MIAYKLHSSCFCEIWALCASRITYNIYIYIYIYYNLRQVRIQIQIKIHVNIPSRKYHVKLYYIHYMRCLCDLVSFAPSTKNTKNTHGGMLLLAKLQACNFTKSNNPPWVFFTFFKWYKWEKIAQNITYYSF